MHAERFTGRVEAGKVVFDQPGRWRAAVTRQNGKRIEVTFQRLRQARSLKANAYLWVLYDYIADWSGHSKEEIHDAMRALHLPAREITLPTGELVRCLGSTRLLKTEEFADYITRVKVWAAEQGLPLPDCTEVGDL